MEALTGNNLLVTLLVTVAVMEFINLLGKTIDTFRGWWKPAKKTIRTFRTAWKPANESWNRTSSSFRTCATAKGNYASACRRY